MPRRAGKPRVDWASAHQRRRGRPRKIHTGTASSGGGMRGQEKAAYHCGTEELSLNQFNLEGTGARTQGEPDQAAWTKRIFWFATKRKAPKHFLRHEKLARVREEKGGQTTLEGSGFFLIVSPADRKA